MCGKLSPPKAMINCRENKRLCKKANIFLGHLVLC